MPLRAALVHLRVPALQAQDVPAVLEQGVSVTRLWDDCGQSCNFGVDVDRQAGGSLNRAYGRDDLHRSIAGI